MKLYPTWGPRYVSPASAAGTLTRSRTSEDCPRAAAAPTRKIPRVPNRIPSDFRPLIIFKPPRCSARYQRVSTFVQEEEAGGLLPRRERDLVVSRARGRPGERLEEV